MPYKVHEPRRHKIPRARYKARNWPAYDRPLQQRGSLTLWVTPEALAAWHPPRTGQRGRPRDYSGRGDRNWAPAAPGLWSALEANRRSAALAHDSARGEPRGAGPHHVFSAQPWPGARDSAGASPGERAGSRRDRRDRAEGLRRG